MSEPAREYPMPMRKFDNWVVWREIPRQDDPSKTTKILYTPVPAPQKLHPASSTDPETWESYPMAKAIADRRDDVDGLGFVFSPDDPFCGVDLDAAIDDSGAIAPWAEDIVQSLNTYTEFSPSGFGLHLIVKAELPGRGRKQGSHDTGEIGMYDRGRFFTFTGDRSPYNEFREPQDRQRQTETLYRAIFPETPPPAPRTPRDTAAEELTDDEVVTKLNAERNGKGHALWTGEISEYESASEADLALCSKIAFYTGPDQRRIEDVFALSALGKRGKWLDRDRYRSETIAKALASIDAYWTPSSPARRGDRPYRGDRGTDPKPKSSTRGDTPYRGDRGTDPKPRVVTNAPPAMPFPIDAMPEACSTLITEGVASLGCAPELLGIPQLSVLSGGIGTSRVAQIKRDWKEFPTLFLCVVANPGSMKSPAAAEAFTPVYAQQAVYQTEYFTKKSSYEDDLRKWEVEKKLAQKDNKPAPAPPEAPLMRRNIASDTTIEAMVSILEENPRGINIHVDEIAGWVRSMDQYKSGGKGSDRQHWLSIWSNQPMVVDRKARAGEPIILSRPYVSLFGGTQPHRLGELGGVMQDGMMDRFLFGYPATRHLKYSHAEIGQVTQNRYASLYDNLIKLKAGEDGSSGRISPKPVEFSFQAKRLFAEHLDMMSEESLTPGFPHRLEGVWAKMRGYLARIALVLSSARYVSLKPSVREKTSEQIEHEDVERAILLLDYFKAHARRVYNALEEADPVDLFAADLKDFLETQENHTWISPAAEMLEALDAAGVANLPDDPSMLTRTIQQAAQHSPSLHIKRGKAGNKDNKVRTIKVWLQMPEAEATIVDTPVPPVGTVRSVPPTEGAQQN